MIFQPTNVIPSATGNLGDGTVDITKGLNVSWMVNGNSPMTAFEITIFQNNAASTELYSTGKLADNCPFYGVSYDGEQQYFSYSIPAGELIDAGLVNGSEYKLIITQYWGDNDGESITQTSASAFITRSTPRLSLMTILSPIASKEYTFYGSYVQDQGDTLNWVRWQLAFADDINNPFYDSQNIYGTAELRLTYDGFFTGNNYAVNLTVQTENGVLVSTGWQTFEVRYATSETLGIVNAQCLGKGHTGIKVSWPLLSYIPGKASGNYEIKGSKKLVLDYGANILWNTSNQSQIDFATPWSILFKGRVKDANAQLFSLTTQNGIVNLKYDYQNQKLSLMNDAKELLSTQNVPVGAEISAIISPLVAYIKVSTATGGLYPTETLYPAENLYPQDNAQNLSTVNGGEISYVQGNINSLSISGGLIVEFLQVLSTDNITDVISSFIQGNTYTPQYDGNTYFLSDFSDGLNAGNVKGIGGDLIGITLYRQDGNNRNLLKIKDTTPNVSEIVDFSVGSQQGPYIYYVFPQSRLAYISAPLVSNEVTPCFWNWTILSCTQQDDKTYSVNAEYLFGKNLSSGSISNNNAPNVLSNFTRYPTVQKAPQNYMSGSLTSLIGVVDSNGQYSDTLALRDAIYALSTTNDTLFLKNRKGDFFLIEISSAITMETMDNTREQAQNTVIPWVQTFSGKGVSVVSMPQDQFFQSI